MQAIDAVKQAAKMSGVPTTHIGVALGHSAAYVASTATRGSTPKADTLAKMLNVCGYDLCAIPKDEVPGTALVIDANDTN